MTPEEHQELEELKAELKKVNDFFEEARGRINASIGHFMSAKRAKLQDRIKELEAKQ